jgi:hypothetical protein
VSQISSHPDLRHTNVGFSSSAMITVNVATVITILVYEPSAFSTVLGLPNIVLESAMACCVFRQIRIGLITGFNTTSMDPTSLHFAQRSHPPTGMIQSGERHVHARGFESSHRVPINIEITLTESREHNDLSDRIPMSDVVKKDTVVIGKGYTSEVGGYGIDKK